MLREVPAPPREFGPSTRHPTILAASSGGVYLREDDTLRKVAEGRLMSVGQSHAVVEQCDSPFDCRTVWFDIDTWEVETELQTPKVQNPFFLFLMTTSPDASHAFVFDYTDAGGPIGSLWDLQNGSVVVDGLNEDFFGVFSPGSRYGASFLRSGDLLIVDTLTGNMVEWDIPGRNPGVQLVFVES